MRKILSFILVGCLLACGSNEASPVIEEQDFGYNMNYHTLQNTFKMYSVVTEIEDGAILLIPSYENEAYSGYVGMSYLDKNDHLEIIDDDASSNCSFTDLKSCSSTIESERFLDFFTYYGNYIYYLDVISDKSNNVDYDVLMRMNLDGGNRKEIFRFEPIPTAGEVILFIAFHQNYMYFVNNLSGVQRMSLETNEVDEEFKYFENYKVNSMFFHGDNLYVGINDYKENDDLYAEATVKVDLKTNETTFMFDEIPYYMNDDIAFVGKLGEEAIYFRNLKSGDEIKLFDSYATHFFEAEGYYVVDTGLTSREEHTVYLIDENGTILDTIVEVDDNQAVGQGVINDKYYVYDTLTMKYHYYGINDGKFLERVDLKYE